MQPRVDATGFGDVRVLQDSEAFCYGADAVLLAGFAAEFWRQNGKRPERLCDLGTGTGIIPLILSHKTDISELCGLEVQDASFRLAEENIRLNHLENRLRFFCGNVRDHAPDDGLVRVLGGAGSFDAVTCNPPYTAGSSGLQGANKGRIIARHETCGTLGDFLAMAAVLLKDKADLFLIHRPSRLTDIMSQMRERGIEPKDLMMISGKKDQKPNLVLIRGTRGGGHELNVLPPAWVREDDGSFSLLMKRYYEID